MSSKGHYRSKPNAMAPCAWCGERKPLPEMRDPSSSRGKTPSTCHTCREGHPDEAWCDFHGQAHRRSLFQKSSRPIGVYNICRDATAYQAATKRAKPHRRCPSCNESRESWFFRGGGNKSPVCRICEEQWPEQRWCIDCSTWLPFSQFHRTGVGNKFLTVRCKPCRITNDHGVTRAIMEEITGSSEPACAACGSTEALKIDHDHKHCPTHRGCRECVRGYLCHQCNTAEGLLRTAERARLLADYMEKWSVGS